MSSLFASQFVPSYRMLAPFYDHLMGNAVAPVIERNLERSRLRYGFSFSSAADIGCGTGKLLCYLARFCGLIYGVDCSAAMLEQARRRVGHIGTSFLQQDIRRLHLPRPVDIITCTFDTLNYLTSPSSVADVFERVRRNLRVGGHLIFDIITGAGEHGRFHSWRRQIQLPSATFTWLVNTDGSRNLSRVEITCRRKGTGGRIKTVREVHIQRWYPVFVMQNLLEARGLRVLGIHDVVSYEVASADTWWAHFVVTV